MEGENPVKSINREELSMCFIDNFFHDQDSTKSAQNEVVFVFAVARFPIVATDL